MVGPIMLGMQFQANGKKRSAAELNRVRKIYDYWAPIYDCFFGLVTFMGRRKIVDFINTFEKRRVLEIGVGTGCSLPRYDTGHTIVGIDISPRMLAVAQRRVEKTQTLNVEALLEMDAQELTFSDNSFDAVVATYVLSTVPDPKQVVAEMRRVCKPGGVICIANHFSVENGVLRLLDRRCNAVTKFLGWRSYFPMSLCWAENGWKLYNTQKVFPFGLFTVSIFENEHS